MADTWVHHGQHELSLGLNRHARRLPCGRPPTGPFMLEETVSELRPTVRINEPFEKSCEFGQFTNDPHKRCPGSHTVGQFRKSLRLSDSGKGCFILAFFALRYIRSFKH